MKELSIKDLELVHGGMGVVPRVGPTVVKIISKPPPAAATGAAVGAGTHMTGNYLKGQPNTGEGILGAMAGGAVGGHFSGKAWGGFAGEVTGSATEGVLTGQSPLQKQFHKTPDQSGNDYGQDGTGYGN